MAAPSAAWCQQPPVEVSAGRERLEYSYRFENDSSFDTPVLVPHFFEQHYETTRWVLSARARYRLLGRPLATTVSFAPEDLAFGSDFDTFFQPTGDVATSGTAGDVRLSSLGVSQSVAVMWREHGSLHVRLSWRRDRADFLPADRIVTHTQPPSETREWTTDRERTVSNVFESGLDARWSRGSLDITAHASPVVLSRLLVLLPDKYPGRDIRFDALGWGAGARAAASRPVGPATIGVWISAEKIGRYRERARYARTAIAAGLSIATR